ncbi:CDP-glucose 4,6-dehydratase [Thermodesulfobacteriota bacterium]
MEGLEMLNLFSGTYKNKNVLVTGHTGFKGSWLALWLEQMGANVIGYSLEPPTQPNHFDLLDFNINSVIGNIKDLESLKKTFSQYCPDIVFHLAAQPLVRQSYKEPVDTFMTNVIGTVNILEACRQTKSVKAIVNVTSDKCYENREWVWGYRENDPMGGFDPYSASKGCSELATSCYRNSFGGHQLLIASARAGNVIGGGDWGVDRLVPDMCKKAVVDQTTEIRNPNATRPWQHVLEPLSGYLLLGQKMLEGHPQIAGAWNFGPSDTGNLSVRDVAEKLQQYWRFNIKFAATSHDLHEARLLKLDCSKAYAKLKWRPVWNNEQMLKATAEWYKEFYENNHILTHQQLATYIDDAKNIQIIWTG